MLRLHMSFAFIHKEVGKKRLKNLADYTATYDDGKERLGHFVMEGSVNAAL